MSRGVLSGRSSLTAVGAVIAAVVIAIAAARPPAEPATPTTEPSSDPQYRVTVQFSSDVASGRFYALEAFTVTTTGVFDPPQPRPRLTLKRVDDGVYAYEGAGRYREGGGLHGEVSVKVSLVPSSSYTDDPDHLHDQLACSITAGPHEDDDIALPAVKGDRTVECRIKV